MTIRMDLMCTSSVVHNEKEPVSPNQRSTKYEKLPSLCHLLATTHGVSEVYMSGSDNLVMQKKKTKKNNKNPTTTTIYLE